MTKTPKRPSYEWTRDSAAQLLSANGHACDVGRPLNNGSGWQFRLETGEVVNVYSNGRVYVQGRDPISMQALFDGSHPSSRQQAAEHHNDQNYRLDGDESKDLRREIMAIAKRHGLVRMKFDSRKIVFSGELRRAYRLLASDAELVIVLRRPRDSKH